MARLKVPSLDEVGAAFWRVTERARACIKGEVSVPYQEGQQRDCDAIEGWVEAESADLGGRGRTSEGEAHERGPSLEH